MPDKKKLDGDTDKKTPDKDKTDSDKDKTDEEKKVQHVSEIAATSAYIATQDAKSPSPDVNVFLAHINAVPGMKIPGKPYKADKNPKGEGHYDIYFNPDIYKDYTEGGEKSNVERNKLEDHEYLQAQEIVNFKGGEFKGQTVRDTPGIDGYLDGKPVSLKEYSGDSPAGVLKHASKAELQLSNAGISNADVFINAKQLKSDLFIDFVQNGPLKDIPSQGIVDKIYVQVSDGWIEIGKKSIKKVQ